jgi:hypothetical protein
MIARIEELKDDFKKPFPLERGTTIKFIKRPKLNGILETHQRLGIEMKTKIDGLE